MRKIPTKVKKVWPYLIALGSATTGLKGDSWLELPADKHPFDVINKTLGNLRLREEYVEEIHLIAHGNNDGIELGGEWIDKAKLQKYAVELSQWRVKAIVLWCCNIGQNKDFIRTLESLTGSEVFASSEAINKYQLKTKNENGDSRNLNDLLQQDVISKWRGELSAIQRGTDIDGNAKGDRSGWSVSLSADGNTLAVGARQDDSSGDRSGSTQIYTWNGTAWSQLGDDIDGEAAEDESGHSVSLSADGTTVAIGARRNDGNGNNSGHTRIYSWNGTAWDQLGNDIDGEAADDESGYSVSLSANGTTVAIGARRNDGNGNSSGHTRIYSWNGTAWNQLGNDIDGEAANDFSGTSVSLSNDGKTVAIGAHKNDGNGSKSGHVRIYNWNGTAWSQLGSDIDGEASDDESGFSVSLAGNGTVVAVSAHQNDGNGTNAGHTKIYAWDGTTWNQLGNDIDGEAANDGSGYSVAISTDGNTIAISARLNDGNGTNSGQTRIYSWSGNTWSQLGSDIDGEASDDESGFSVSLSDDGTTVAIGARQNDGNGTNSGHVRVFDLSATSSNPNITAITGISDNTGGFNTLNFASGVTTVAIAGITYALVAAHDDNGIELINISDPANPVATKSITDGTGGFDTLAAASEITTTNINGNTYALVTARDDNGIQIINITDPANPSATASITDGAGGFDELQFPTDITTIQIRGSHYALAVGHDDNGIQIININDPSNPGATASLTDGVAGFNTLGGATGIATAFINGSIYALVASQDDNGLEIIDITDPDNPSATASVRDGVNGFNELEGARHVTTISIDGSTYALVASYKDDGVQIINISDPSNPTAASNIADGINGFDELEKAWEVTTTTLGGNTYALVTSKVDDGIQVININDPTSPTAAGSLTDGVNGINELDGSWGITTTNIGEKIYVLATGSVDDGVQIIRLEAPDLIAPTITITDDDADNSLSAGDTATLTFTLSEASTDFVEADVVVSGGSLSNWTAVSSTVYTTTFTPTENSTTDSVISVASSKFSDAAGNNNLDGSDANNSVTFSVNTITSSSSPSQGSPSSLILNEDNSFFVTEGSSQGLWINLKVTLADANLQNNLTIVNQRNDALGSIGATNFSRNLGEHSIFIPEKSTIRFKQLSGNQPTNNSPQLSIDDHGSGTYLIELNDSNDDDDYNDLCIEVSYSSSSPAPEATTLATEQLEISDAIIDLTSIPEAGKILKITVNSDADSVNRLALVRLQEDGDGSFMVGGLKNIDGESFDDMVWESLVHPGDSIITATGDNQEQYDWFVPVEDAGFYAPVLITQEDEIITYGSREVKNLGCNFFGFEDQGSHVRCDWDYNDLTARIEVAGISTLSDIF